MTTDITSQTPGMRIMPRELLRFPYRQIIQSWTLEEVFVRFVWLAIPLEYFVLTRFSGGLTNRDGVAVALIALLALLAVLAVSLALAVIPRPGRSSYGDRVRIWSVSLVVSWAAALLMLAIGYAISLAVGWQSYDALAQQLDGRARLDDYPSMSDGVTFIIYFVYALLGAVVIATVAWKFGRAPCRRLPPGPNVFVVVALSASIMTVMHAVTRLH
jgi:hypothetical protein